MLPSVPRFLFSANCARSLSTAASTSPGRHYPYYVPRNSRGSLPVYTDIRNAGTRHQTLVRNVEGDVNALAKDLTTALSLSPQHVRVAISHQRHIVLTGGLFKREVVEYLRARGF